MWQYYRNCYWNEILLHSFTFIKLALLYCHIPFNIPLKLSALMVLFPVLQRRTEEVETDIHCPQHPLPGKRCVYTLPLDTYHMYVIFGRVKKDTGMTLYTSS